MNAPPTIHLELPAGVHPGETFNVTATVKDAEGRLNSFGIRWQGRGLIDRWDVTGAEQTRGITVTAPESGPLNFRAEVFDADGNGVTGDWFSVPVTPRPIIEPPPEPPVNLPPTIQLDLPSSVQAGETFNVTATVKDAEGRLIGFGIRWQGHGLIDRWDVTGAEQTRGITVTAPETGPLNFRAEVFDADGNGVTGDWFSVSVTPRPAETPPPPPYVPIPLAQEVAAPNTEPEQPESPWEMEIEPAYVIPDPLPTISGFQSENIPEVTAPEIPHLDNFQPEAQSAAMPAGVAPMVSLQMPKVVFAGDSFWVTATADDPDKDFSHLSIRWQGRGIVDTFDISGTPYPQTSRRSQVTAPSSGPLLFRAEVTDQAGNGFTSEWQEVAVIPEAAPALDLLDEWVRLRRVQTSTLGVYQNILEIVPGAPSLVQAAIGDAQIVARDLGGIGGYTPEQLYNAIRGAYVSRAAEMELIGVDVAPVQSAGNTGEETTTIVAYEGTNPVLQQITEAGAVVQWTETPAGATPVVEVENFGVYEAPPPAAAVNAVSDTPTPEAAAAINGLDETPFPMLTRSPTIALTLPSNVRAGETFNVTLTASDPDGDLNSMGIRWQGQGIVDRWDFVGNSASQTRSVAVTAPLTGPLLFRGEVFDNSGNGVTGDWQVVDVGGPVTASAVAPTNTKMVLVIGGAAALAWWLSKRKG